MAMHRAGATAVVMNHFDPEQALRLIEQHKVTFSQWVPTMFIRMLKLPAAVRAAYHVSSQRVVTHSAAPCPIEIKQQMIDWWWPILIEYYGATEGHGGTQISSAEWLLHRGSVGRPVYGNVNVYPQETENVLVLHPAVADVAVIGIPNEDLGEEVKAVVEPFDMAAAGPQLEHELIAWYRARLSHIKCPRSIDVEAKLPRSDAGKLFKRTIRDRYWQGRNSAII
jgi:acyl-CoA synthetase (AMP-forming)/AMP-acid ligase II